MTRVFWRLSFACTASGLALLAQPPAAWPWWDPIWIFVFFIAVYADLAGWAGLRAARLAAGIAVISLAALLGLGALTGWPVGPLRFTEHSGLRLGGAVPLGLPLLGFALLTVSGQAAAAAFPGAGKPGLAAGTAAAFLLTVANGIAFFSVDRIWWLWNPWGDGPAAGRAALSLCVLGAVGFALAFVYPADSRLRLSRWSPGAIAWVATNALFLAARLA
ncbi:MAG: hypothetical protein WCS65_07150 [Verrucomicrobiae bacterium]